MWHSVALAKKIVDQHQHLRRIKALVGRAVPEPSADSQTRLLNGSAARGKVRLPVGTRQPAERHCLRRPRIIASRRALRMILQEMGASNCERLGRDGRLFPRKAALSSAIEPAAAASPHTPQEEIFVCEAAVVPILQFEWLSTYATTEAQSRAE